MGIKVFRVRVSVPEGTTFRKGSSKKSIMLWCLSKGEFTKAEFLEAVQELKRKGEVDSVMSDEVCARAWWNELYNKYRYLVDAD